MAFLSSFPEDNPGFFPPSLYVLISLICLVKFLQTKFTLETIVLYLALVASETEVFEIVLISKSYPFSEKSAVALSKISFDAVLLATLAERSTGVSGIGVSAYVSK